MNELQELYQQVILDHNKNPRNFAKPEEYSHTAEGLNPLCGDCVNVYLTIENDRISDVHFQGEGCAISKASASIMTDLLKGKTTQEAEQFFEQFHDLVTAAPGEEVDFENLGKMAVFAGVREFPARIKCATLAWHTVHSALHGKKSVDISTS